MGDMKIVTVHLNEETIRMLDILIRNGFFANRAEVIRTAVVKLLRDYNWVFSL